MIYKLSGFQTKGLYKAWWGIVRSQHYNKGNDGEYQRTNKQRSAGSDKFKSFKSKKFMQLKMIWNGLDLGMNERWKRRCSASDWLVAVFVISWLWCPYLPSACHQPVEDPPKLIKVLHPENFTFINRNSSHWLHRVSLRTWRFKGDLKTNLSSMQICRSTPFLCLAVLLLLCSVLYTTVVL